MFTYDVTELNTIESQLEPLLKRAKESALEAERLAMDATRLLTTTPQQLESVKNQPFFQRLKRTLLPNKPETINATDLLELQKISWRYIDMLNERDLMMASSMITVKNNLMALAITSEETRHEITRMADKIVGRFERLEDRMKHVEVQMNIHGWLLTIKTRDYDTKYSPMLRMLKVIQDFMQLKNGEWNINEIRYLQMAIKDVDLDWKRNIKIGQFIFELIDEIERSGFNSFQGLVVLKDTESKAIDDRFILENISAPSFKALYQLANQHTYSNDVIDALVGDLKITKSQALKRVLVRSIQKEGVDVHSVISLRDLAVELLTCASLAQRLYGYESVLMTMEIPTQEVINTSPYDSLTEKEKSYVNDVLDMLAEGGLGEKERRFLMRTRQHLGLSEEHATQLDELAMELKQAGLTDNEKMYLREYQALLADGIISEKERNYLEKTRRRLNLSETRAKQLEHNSSK